ncbi:MAG: LPD7 domain-containing protein [Saezia sp.]
MLARVTAGKSGIVEYLENGIKSGRELSRDELDERMCIDGNLSITDKIISQLNEQGRNNNYLHITLSFSEKHITHELMLEAYNSYKDMIMSASDPAEYNVYAEIHYPKVKSYEDRKTGETVERYPHIHMVLPQKNLITNKAFTPFGLYVSNVKYFDAIQEAINRKLELNSPYDHQRVTNLFEDNSAFISRYKGDTFKGTNATLKRELFDVINDKNIRTMDGFEKELSKYGVVSKGKNAANEEYFKVKLEGASKNIRLKETCFNSHYIVDRQLLRQKPTDKQVNSLVNEWVNTRSHEMKHIQIASPKLRAEYYALQPSQRQEFLNEQRRQFNSKNNIGESRRATDRKPCVERVGLKRFAEIRNGLPSLPQRSLVRTNRERPTIPESILSRNEHHHLESSRTSRDHQLRRAINRSGGDWGRGRLHNERGNVGLPVSIIAPKAVLAVTAPRTYAEQLLHEHKANKIVSSEIDHFRTVRQQLDPERVLSHFEKSHGLVRDNYTTFNAKDGSSRIKIGSRAFNVSDFCTKHMCQSWDETKKILSESYRAQQHDKQEQQTINSIVFSSRYATQSYTSKNKLERLDESLMIFKWLQRQERSGVNIMPLSDLEKFRENVPSDTNSIENATISLSNSAENYKRQQQIIKELSFKMSDFVASKDLKNKQVNFTDKHSGEDAFKDLGDKLVMSKRTPELEHVAAALTLASEKFGKLKINGSAEFKQQVIDVAIAKNLNVVFDSPKMQAEFIKQKQAHSPQATAQVNPIKANDVDKKEVKSASVAKQAHSTQSTAQVNPIKANDIDKKEVKSASVAVVTPQQTRTHTYETRYKWNATEQKMDVTINGKLPSAIPSDTLNKIVANDKFLSKYPIVAVQTGKLDLSVANGVQPVPRQYNEQGQQVNAQNAQVSIEMTH